METKQNNGQGQRETQFVSTRCLRCCLAFDDAVAGVVVAVVLIMNAEDWQAAWAWPLAVMIKWIWAVSHDDDDDQAADDDDDDDEQTTTMAACNHKANPSNEIQDDKQTMNCNYANLNIWLRAF